MLLCIIHIDTIPNRTSRPAYVLRASVREGKRVTKRTLANLSALPIEPIEAIRHVLRGEKLGAIGDGRDCVATRQLAATTKELEKIKAMVMVGRLEGRDKIGVRVGKVVAKYTVAKHFDLDIRDGAFAFAVNADRVAAEAALDGLYVIPTSVAAEAMSAEGVVLNDKTLAQAERAFRSLKGAEPGSTAGPSRHVRPIRHRLDDRVKAHIFLSMLAYYVQWHMIQAWVPLTCKDEADANAAHLRSQPIEA